MSENILGLIKRRCDMWINELGNTHIDKMYKHIASGKMLRSKLVLAICNIDFDPYPTKTTKTSANTKNMPKQANSSALIKQNNPSTATSINLVPALLKEQIIDLCAIIELIQCASLLHDDVIDDAATRRGKPSIKAEFGNKRAIMLGDVLYSSAYIKLCSFSPPIAKCIANAVNELSCGEIDDVLYADTFQKDIQIYYKIVRYKTASLIKASAMAAALLMGKNAISYGEYGENLGMAFQIIDDVLDITQDEKTLGKPSMSDVKEGKSTLAYILLFNKLTQSSKKTFLNAFKKADKKSLDWIKEQFYAKDIIKQCQQIATDFINAALKAIDSENNAKLNDVAISMLKRSF